ncbi:helix-turn-helix transcriptional regulator [Phyllobacterium sp. 22552]|uniref:helix-turn-helix transcriptional regulator n=1 Tax=Phyllobacterium sp. 22552 TaxID=3453941 RepID=UPI003F85775C
MRLLSSKDLKAKGIDVSRAQLYRLMNAGKFPKPVKIGTKSNAWVEAEIDAWMMSRIEERDRGAAA